MSIPPHCQVLIIGGGPAGSYAAASLAREGFETVLLEADKFPRYHIGESTLPSLRHFLKFIDLDDAFDAHGFYKKNGAVFRLNQSQPDAYTDFIAAGGPNGYAWNLLRSESDDLLFRHAGACGAHAFDETKVDTIAFDGDADGSPQGTGHSSGKSTLGRPLSANWTRRDGSTGTTAFEYLIDASGRHGIMSTKYLKSRKFNQNFKNVAQWAYWQSDEVYGAGTHMEGAPYFEALEDASGWCWFMPLHDGTRSVGIVQDQTLATNKKRHLQHPSTQDFYMHSLALAPRCKRLLQDARLVGNVRSASDWSYTSSTYHLPYARICGDAGCFIDPLFSSGVHLAITGGLSAAVTISASLRGECDEHIAGSWHSKKTIESYTRFFLAVSSATKQIRSHDEPVLQDIDEVGFQRAFDLLRPIIQGSVDADGSEKMSQSDISEVLQFCFRAFTYVSPEKKDALFEKLKHLGFEAGDVNATTTALEDVKKLVTPEEWHVIETLRSRRMIREDPFDIESFTLDTIDGLAPRLERGNLGLTKAKKAKLDSSQFYSPSFLDGKVPGIREGTMHQPVA